MRSSISRVAIVSACFVAAAVPVRGDLNDGLACYWSFDEGSGVIVHDGSPSGYDGTRYGAQWVEGRVQGALAFDGVNDFVQVPDAVSTPPAALGAFSQGSIALWFKVDTLPPSPSIHPLFSYGTGSSLSFLDRVIIEIGHMGGDQNADKLYFTLGDNGSHPTLCFDSGSVVDAGAWYHFVGVVGPDFNTGYLNGREMTDRHYNFGDENDSVFFDDVVDRDVLWMGRAGFSLEPHWCDGVIDEVRVYDRPLTSSEVEALYRQGCPADIDLDGEVGITDFLLMLGVWGPCAGCPEDVDGDDVVGIQDFLLLLATWGPC